MRRAAIDIDENRSAWIDGADPGPPLPDPASPLSDATLADVVIIGGGFTGVSTAYHLSRRFPDKRVVLLEARSLANGASGRNGGQMLNWINGVDSTDPELTRRVYAATKEGIDLIEGVIREHGLRVRYKREGALQVKTDALRAEAAHAHVEELNQWGIPVQFLQGKELAARIRMEGAHGAIFDSSEGQLNGVDYIRALRPVLTAQGVVIHENTPVTAVREGSTITLTTPRGELKAKAIVIGTNGYSPRLGYFRYGVFPLHSHVLSTEPLAEAEREAVGFSGPLVFCDDLDRIAYGAMTPDGRIIFGGGSNASYNYLWGNRTQFPGSPASAEKSFDVIYKQLLRYFPAVARFKVTQRWTGTLGITMSRVCSMGVRGEHKNIYYALGYSGHGVTLANLAGKVLCDMYSGDDERWRGLPFYQRRLGGIPPEPFRWIGYHVYTRLTGRSPRKQA